MLLDPIEKFGAYEKNYTLEQKEEIAQFMKYDHRVPINLTEMVLSAETETEYFGKVGTFMGTLAFGAFLFFPVIRGLPIKRRVFFSALPGLYCHYWGQYYKEQLWWNKTYNAYQRFIVQTGQHQKVFI